MHPNFHQCIYESSESFTMDDKVYTVKLRAFTVYLDGGMGEVDNNDIVIEHELSYKPCNNHDSEREIVSMSIMQIGIDDIESIYSAFTDTVIGKVSNERLRITARKQGMYNTLYRYKDLIETITLDKDKRKAFCQEVLSEDDTADSLLKYILTGCVTEIHERYRENENVG